MELLKDIPLFMLFFMPGFISIKIYDMLVPNESRDFSKAIYEVVAYSALNLAAFSWVIYIMARYDFYVTHPFWYALILFLMIFIFPIIWPFLLLRVSSCKCIAKYIIHPIKKPWDYMFGKKEPFWIIVTLKDGRRIGGKYDSNSFASSYPAEEQIFIEEVWELDEKGAFKKAIESSKGILIWGRDVLALEFLK